MPRKPALAMSLLVFLATTACSSQSPMDKQPDIKLNQHPTQRYEITVTTDAPGDWDTVEGYVLYEINNVDCVPADSLNGGRKVPNTVRDFELLRVDDMTYKGYFYRDLLQDDDYFGLGICHWEVMSVGPRFTVHGLRFMSGDALKQALSGKQLTEYFSKRAFFDHSLNDGNSRLGLSFGADEVQSRADYFKVTVSVEEVAQ